MDSQPEHDERAALEVAARALRMRDVSSSVLERKLADAGIDDVTRQKALDHLTAAGLVDDARMAEVRARSLADRGYGDAAIEARLAASGIGREEREQAIAALEPEQARARTLAASRPRPDRRKLELLLSRRGFSPHSIEAAVERLDGDRDVLDGPGEAELP